MPDPQLTPAQAQAEIQNLRNDPVAAKKIIAGDLEACQRSDSLHRLAHPEGAPPPDRLAPPVTLTQQPERTPDEAAATIKARMADKEFTARYQLGDTAARAEMDALHKQASPLDPAEVEAAKQIEAQAGKPAPIKLEMEFGPEFTPETITEATTLAETTIAHLGLPNDQAEAGVKLLEHATKQREGRPMNVEELAKLDRTLERKWGVEFDARMSTFETVMRDTYKKSPEGALWLQRAMLVAGPEVAVFTMNSLVEHAMARKAKP